jgi:hypothetical protein
MEILYSARDIDTFVSRARLTANTINNWKAARYDFDKMAGAYGISWKWTSGTYNQPTTTNQQTSSSQSYSNGLTGTYRLDSSRSERVQDIVEQALKSTNISNRDEVQDDLEQKLQAPEEIAIDLGRSEVTLASTLSDKLILRTDGTPRTETLSDGSTIKITARLRGQELSVASVGDRSNYAVTFALMDNGQGLKVSRRVTTDYLTQTIFADSYYSKSDSVARFDIFGSQNSTTAQNGNSGTQQPSISRGRTGQFVVPNGTIITGTLNNDVSTKVSQNNDRFRMTVTAPSQFRGAVIEGYISGIRNRSGKVTGRSQVTFNFESIRLANGETYDFAGFLQSVTDQNGDTVKVDTEGNAKGDSQTKESLKRGGIGAGIGAVIGAVIGGTKGAIIGATIGGGAGAGSVILQKDGELDLKAGSSITVQSSSPNSN